MHALIGMIFQHHISVVLKHPRDLAANIGLKFYTPEEYFLREDPEPFQRLFEPARYLGDQGADETNGSIDFKVSQDQDIVMFCGSPGAGKSTFFWRHLQPHGYERVNQDLLKTVGPSFPPLGPHADTLKRDRCLKVARDHLSTGLSVAIGS